MSHRLDAIAALYGWNWAAQSEREACFTQLPRDCTVQFARGVGRWPAPATLSLAALRAHAEAIEVEYQRFVYSLKTLEPRTGAVVASGELEAIGRASRESLCEPFAHRWVLEGDRVSRVEPGFGHPLGRMCRSARRFG